MSRLQETKRAYDKLAELLDQEIRRRRGSARELERFREILNTAFYVLGWGQFEYLVRNEAEERIDDNARTKTDATHAWNYLKENIKNFSVRHRLEFIFHGKHDLVSALQKDYTVRNEAIHDYKLPREAKDVSVWLATLEQLIDRF